MNESEYAALQELENLTKDTPHIHPRSTQGRQWLKTYRHLKYIVEGNNVVTLAIDKIDLKVLPTCIGEFPFLHQLNLTYLGLTDLPDTISNLRELRMLMLNGNPLKNLPSVVGTFNRLNIYLPRVVR